MTTTGTLPDQQRRILAAILVAMCITITVFAVRALRHPITAVGDVPARVIAPLLAEDWNSVLTATAAPCCSDAAPSPTQMIRAQALLASNHNTDTACILLHSNERSLHQWSDWTAKLLRTYPSDKVSHYLRADALARSSGYEQAIAEYDEALKSNPHYALALNGRGQVHAALKQWPEAIADLEDAAKADPHLADAFANRGWVFIQKRSGAQGAVDWFNRALHESPQFTIARHGLGCAELVMGNIQHGLLDFKSPKGQCVESMAAENAFAIMAFLKGMSRQQLAASLLPHGAGMSLSTRFSDPQALLDTWRSNPTQSNFNGMMNGINSFSNQDQSSFFNSYVKPVLQHNPDLSDKFQTQANTIGSWNSGLGGEVGRDITSITASLGTALGFSPQPVMRITGAGITIGGTLVGQGFDDWSEKNRNVYNNIEQTFSDMRTNHGFSEPAGGVIVNFSRAQLDDGEWPFSAVFSLQYSGRFPDGREKR